ncbi:hypothetical protein [Microlunatus flavus]|uniref:hypothetical protein n=1 Tax=Microlunatus flavus TaxID=1036181 RepID=UPI0011140C1C|nr:hypothetical protein [Microlunatus flavus]
MLGLVLAVGAGLVALTGRAPVASPPVAPPPVAPATSARPSTTAPPPRPGPAYPVRRVGTLGDRSALVSGRGDAQLRYTRAPGNGTRLHFICTGCDARTWLVEWPRGTAVGGGPLADPTAVTATLDTSVGERGVRGRATRLVVAAPAHAEWTVTLTPFDVVPLHEATFDGLGDDVVAVRARGDLALRCGAAGSFRVLARPARAAEYVDGGVRRTGATGTSAVPAVRGTDRLVVEVACPGRWTLTLP